MNYRQTRIQAIKAGLKEAGFTLKQAKQTNKKDPRILCAVGKMMVLNPYSLDIYFICEVLGIGASESFARAYRQKCWDQYCKQQKSKR